MNKITLKWQKAKKNKKKKLLNINVFAIFLLNYTFFQHLQIDFLHFRLITNTFSFRYFVYVLVLAESHAAGNCIRSTVAALMNKGDTISASEISSDVRKQREREMNILLNRFNRPVESNGTSEPAAQQQESSRHVRAQVVSGTSSATSMQPPPPPPPPPQQSEQHVEAKCIVKRKSAGK